jgi:hypothetical protein
VSERRPRTWRFSWYEVLLVLCAAANLSGWIGYRFVPPVDETRALAYLAAAIGCTALMVALRRRE